MYIDVDSIQYSDQTKDYCYAMRYTKYSRAEQVVYVRSDFYRDYAGIIRVDDYDYQTYKPKAVFRTGHVFMKPVEEIPFLTNVHEYAASLLVDESDPYTIKKIDNIIRNESRKYKGTRIANIRSYIKRVDRSLKKNWNIPETELKTKVVVNFDINKDGSLNDYKFVKTIGDDFTERSIINAIEQTIPFENLSSVNQDRLLIQVTFNKKGKHSKKVK